MLQAGVGQIPSRQAQIAAGLSEEIGSETINKVCASGMRAVTIADQMIRAGDHEVVVAGGHGVDVATRRTCCRRLGSATGSGTARSSTTMSTTG